MSDHRTPYVGEGPLGCRKSAQIDREEADGLPVLDPRVDELLESADRWEAQAQDLEVTESPLLPQPVRDAVDEIANRRSFTRELIDREAEAALAEVSKPQEPRGYTIEGAAFMDEDHEFHKPADPVAMVRAVAKSNAVTVLASLDVPDRSLDPVWQADQLYARGRRDTPTGTIIARLDPIRDRAAWLQVRRTGIGSSDVPVLLGLSTGEYAKSELDLYMDKRGESPDDESAEAALWGNLLEDPVAREWARRETDRIANDPTLNLPADEWNGVSVHRVGTIAHKEHRHMLCDLDRRVIGCPDHARCALEVKTRSAYKAADWKDGVPEDTLAQVMHQLAVTGYDAIHVAALIGGQRLVTYVVEPDPDFIADLFAIEDQFWRENVQAGVPPAISSLDLLVDHLKHFTPQKGVEREVHGADAEEATYLARRYDQLSADVGELDVVKQRLMALIGEDATDLVAVDDHGDRTPLFTWRAQNKPRQLDKAAVEAVLGAPLDSFKVPTGTTRVLRRVKPK